MNIEVETNFIPLLSAFEPPEGIEIIKQPSREERDLSDISVVTGAFVIGTGIVSGSIGNILGSWIYDKLEKHKDRANLKIGNKETPIEETEIITTITQIVKKKKYKP